MAKQSAFLLALYPILFTAFAILVASDFAATADYVLFDLGYLHDCRCARRVRGRPGSRPTSLFVWRHDSGTYCVASAGSAKYSQELAVGTAALLLHADLRGHAHGRSDRSPQRSASHGEAQREGRHARRALTLSPLMRK